MQIDLGSSKRTKTVTDAVRMAVSGYPKGRIFSVYDLMKDAEKYLDESMHPLSGTYLRIMRKVSRESIVCVNRHRSLYKVV